MLGGCSATQYPVPTRENAREYPWNAGYHTKTGTGSAATEGGIPRLAAEVSCWTVTRHSLRSLRSRLPLVKKPH